MTNHSFVRNHRHSNNILRQCSRCGRELTDSASRECGVGPVCRQKNNDLFAKGITANLPVATALYLDLAVDDFSEHVEGFESMRNAFLDQAVALQATNNDMTILTLSGGDFRITVDWFDYALSFKCKHNVRNKVIMIIDALGYAGLASVLRGDACMSKARVYIKDGRVYLEGKACKAGWLAFRRGVPGCTTPRYRGDKTPYSASVHHAAKFVELANRHWPFNEIEFDLDEVVNSTVVLDAPPAPIGPNAVYSNHVMGFAVAVPWHGTRSEMTTMLDKFKTINKKDRSYDPGTKKWCFKAEHFAYINNIVSQRYNVINNTNLTSNESE